MGREPDEKCGGLWVTRVRVTRRFVPALLPVWAVACTVACTAACTAACTVACTPPPRSFVGRDIPSPDAPLVRELLCLSLHLPMDDSDASRSERARQLDHAETLGVRLLRRDIHWHRLEPVEGELHWETVDDGVDDITDRGMELLALLVYGVPWATTATEDDKMYPPDDPADFARFAGRVAERYADRVRLFEVWNEPNNGWRFWKPTIEGDPEAYGALLSAAGAAIRAAHPDPVVLYGGLVVHEQIVIPSAVDFIQDHFDAPLPIYIVDAE